MPSAWRRDSLTPIEEWEAQRNTEAERRVARFASTGGGRSRNTREVTMLETDDYDDEPAYRDPHTYASARARLIEAMNTRRT